VYWLGRPPWGRYLAAGAVLVLAAWIELRPAPTVERPFAAVDIDAATELTDELIEWRAVPAGAVPAIEPAGFAAVDVPAGSPLVSALLTADRPQAPEGWWVMELELAADLDAGRDLRLIVIPGPGEAAAEPIEAVVVRPSVDGGSFANDEPGLVAVPPDRAADAAVAAAAGRLTVLAGA
jgi:hypothetical protein